MTNELAREYSCKNEELPIICKFAAFSLKRDLDDFTNFSPKFNVGYVSGFEAKIDSAINVMEPASETVVLKSISNRISINLTEVIDATNRLAGYISIAKSDFPISNSDFGLTALRKAVSLHDIEGVIKWLHTVNNNIIKYNDILTVQGLSKDFIARFVSLADSIGQDKQKKYEISINRKNIVHDNLALFNSLYDQLIEIMKIGKVLYKTTNDIKRKEYTFTDLKKQVSRTTKSAGESVAASNNGTVSSGTTV